jgi:hypothetical protein
MVESDPQLDDGNYRTSYRRPQPGDKKDPGGGSDELRGKRGRPDE